MTIVLKEKKKYEIPKKFKVVSKEEYEKIKFETTVFEAEFRVGYIETNGTDDSIKYLRFWAPKVLKKYKVGEKKKARKSYLDVAVHRAADKLNDSDKKVISSSLVRLFEDDVTNDTFESIGVTKMFGTTIGMSMPSLGIKYYEYNDECVPMSLLKHINNPEEENPNKRLKGFTLEKILKLLNETPEQTHDGRCEEDKENHPLEDKPLMEKLKDGYNGYQIMNVCNEAKLKMYMLDHRQNVVLSNIKCDIKFNSNLSALFFMNWNNHMYVIEDDEVRLSIAHNYKFHNSGAKCKPKIEDKKEVKVDYLVMEHIPESFDDIKKNTVIFITNNEVNEVNTFYYDEVKRGIIHIEKLRMKDKEVLSFSYACEYGGIELIYKPDYDEVKYLCDMLNKDIQEKQDKYKIEYATAHSLAMKYYEFNYGHKLSFVNIDGDEVFKSPLNSAFHEFWTYPEDLSNVHAYDFRKHYTSCLLNNELGFSVYTPLDEIETFNYTRDKIEEGFYYVETNNYFPLKGNGWYNGECLIEYVKDDLISIHDIKYQYIAKSKELCMKKNHFERFVNDIFERFQFKKDDGTAKNAMNGFIGMLRKCENVSRKYYMVNNTEDLCRHYNEYINNNKDIAELPVNRIENDENETIAYHILHTKKIPLQFTNAPIHRKIYDLSALFVWRLIKRVGSLKNVWGIHTDAVYFDSGNKLEIDDIKFGGIKSVPLIERCHIKELSQLNEPRRDYNYNKPKSSFNDIKIYADVETKKTMKDYYCEKNKNVEPDLTELYNTKYGCMINGYAGTGKSYLIGKLCKHYDKQNIKYKMCSPTRMASFGLSEDATTIHSLFGIEVFSSDINHSVCLSLKNQGVTHIIIDEISMILENIWGILHHIKKIYGFIFVLVGDFAQLPPVREEHKKKRLMNSKLIKHICDYRRITLTKIHRIKDSDNVFFDELQNARDGKPLNVSLYGNKICDTAIAFTNICCDKHNLTIMEKKTNKRKRLILTRGDKTIYFFEGLKLICDQSFGSYSNCERFIVKKYDEKYIEIESNKQCLKLSVAEIFKNFKVGYATTVHKAQGCTFDEPFTIYQHDKLEAKGSEFIYTALSRSTRLKYINLCEEKEGDLKGYIYCYTNIINNKRYIGSTFSEKQRKKEHKESKEDDKFHTALRDSKNKFEYSLICNVMVDSIKELRQSEKYYIAKFDCVENGYNSKSV